MASHDTAQTATTSTDDRKRAFMRQLSGTSFLTLEHIGYFVLVVLMPVLLLASASIAMNLWQGNGGSSMMPMAYTIEPFLHSIDTGAAISLTAAFVVLAPLMYVLRRRISAEYVKRPGFDTRVAYKLPVYTALALLAAMTIGAFVTMLSVFLNSLVSIGVSGVNIGSMYTGEFLPALLAFAVFGMAAWYTMWFAKGKDTSRMFVPVVIVLAGVMSIALFVTTLTINHDSKHANPTQTQPYPLPDDTPYNNYLQY